MSCDLDLSVIIPAYNEEQRIAATLHDVHQFLRAGQQGWRRWEILVVADGCADRTGDVVTDLTGEIPELKLVSYQPNRGKGFALRAGMRSSQGQLVLFTDADGSTPIREVLRLAAPIAAGAADLVIASRRTRDAHITQRQPWLREGLGRAFSLATRLLIGLPYKDTQCGFKLFRGDVGRRLFGLARCDGFAIDVEVLLWAQRLGLRIGEVGVEWRDDPGTRVKAGTDGLRMLRDAFRAAREVRRQPPPPAVP